MPCSRCFNTSHKIGCSALVFNSIIYINGLFDIGWKSSLSNSLPMHCTAFLCLSDFLFFYLVIATLPFNWISALFCTVLHGIQLGVKAESIIQYAIHCRSLACKAVQRHLRKTPRSNAANESDPDYKYRNRNPLRLISQNEILWFRSVKLKDCFLLSPH